VQIDPQIEQQMRNALAAAIKKDAALFDEATAPLGKPADRATVAKILLLVGTHVLLDMYGGVLPTDDQIHALAAAIAPEEAWSTLTESEIYDYLSLLRGDASREIDPTVGLVLIFAVTGSLLSGGRPKDQRWWEYLDRIEINIENQVS
jgi:hypothetical protein